MVKVFPISIIIDFPHQNGRSSYTLNFVLCILWLFRSPTKSSRKPQKRHFIFEGDDDDDDSSDFQPSPSVRRKLVHSFWDTTATRYIYLEEKKKQN